MFVGFSGADKLLLSFAALSLLHDGCCVEYATSDAAWNGVCKALAPPADLQIFYLSTDDHC
jgi:hypothetical protein